MLERVYIEGAKQINCYCDNCLKFRNDLLRAVILNGHNPWKLKPDITLKTNLLSHETDLDIRRKLHQQHGWVYLSYHGGTYDLCRSCWGGGMFSNNWSI